MKLLVISHPCVRPINQQFYAAVEQATGWALTIAAPARWKDEYGALDGLERWPSFQGVLRALPVHLPGHIPLHVYRTGLAALIREAAPDAIYVHHEPYGLATAQACWANRRTLRRPIGFYSAQNLVKRYPPPFTRLERAVYESASFAFPVSHSVEQTLRTKGYEGAATVLPLAVNSGLYAPHPDGSHLANTWRQGPEETVFGYVGRIAEEKGLETLLHALARTDLPWRLVLVGVGDQEGAIQTLADSLGLTDRITWCGYVAHAEVPRYLSAFDVLVLPSETRKNWKEQFGRVLIEALACGTPVIGSDSGEIPRVVGHTGGGLVFAEGDDAHLAECLRALASDPERREGLAAAGRRAVLDHYTEAVLAERFADTIERAVETDQRSARAAALA